ncbi:hypothetical protein RRG08_050673 [Elysia crispata]|uniref:Uncharacterized protein n=1 Tax=Elysia crispata TaxID=231223 RepID=A0AAE0ZJA4_9GAST|nr:hypothetical protein RRG08_050673 [Elysia crispata]
MSRRNGVRGRCTNWQTGREAEKRGDQDTQRQGTRGKTKAGDGTEEDKEGEIQTGSKSKMKGRDKQIDN